MTIAANGLKVLSGGIQVLSGPLRQYAISVSMFISVFLCPCPGAMSIFSGGLKISSGGLAVAANGIKVTGGLSVMSSGLMITGMFTYDSIYLSIHTSMHVRWCNSQLWWDIHYESRIDNQR